MDLFGVSSLPVQIPFDLVSLYSSRIIYTHFDALCTSCHNNVITKVVYLLNNLHLNLDTRYEYKCERIILALKGFAISAGDTMKHNIYYISHRCIINS